MVKFIIKFKDCWKFNSFWIFNCNPCSWNDDDSSILIFLFGIVFKNTKTRALHIITCSFYLLKMAKERQEEFSSYTRMSYFLDLVFRYCLLPLRLSRLACLWRGPIYVGRKFSADCISAVPEFPWLVWRRTEISSYKLLPRIWPHISSGQRGFHKPSPLSPSIYLRSFVTFHSNPADWLTSHLWSRAFVTIKHYVMSRDKTHFINDYPEKENIFHLIRCFCREKKSFDI